MRKWVFEHEKEPETSQQIRKERRDKAWKEACPTTRQACIQEVYTRTHSPERTLGDEIKGVAVGAVLIAILGNIFGG